MAAIDVKPHTVSFAWSPELDEVATRIAKRVGKPKEEFLRGLLLEALEDSEDYWIAEDAYAEHVRTGGKTYTDEEVRHTLGLED